MTVQSISVLMNNRPGALASVSELFASIGCNIEKLKVGEGMTPDVARMKLVAAIEDDRLDWLLKTMAEMADVIQVTAVRPRTASVAYWLAAYSLFVTILGINIASPLYALYREEWGLTPGSTTLVFAVYALTVIPSIVAFGQLSGRVGPRKILLAGTVLALLGSLGMAAASGVGGLLLARVLQGLSVGMLNGAAVAAMTLLHPQRAGNKAALTAALAVTAGNAIGPVMSGILAQYAPYPAKLPYLAHALLTLPGVIGLLLIRMKVLPDRSISLHLPRVPNAIRPIFYASASASFIAWSVISLFMSVIPSSMSQWIGKPSFIVAGVAVSIALAVSTASQMASKKLAPAIGVPAGYALVLAGLAIMLASVMDQSVSLLLLSAVLVGLGHGPLYAASLAAVSQASPDNSRADIIAFYYVITYMGVALPVLGLGYAQQALGLAGAVAAFAVAMTILIGIGAWGWLRLFRRN